jgi:hypothetical protein
MGPIETALLAGVALWLYSHYKAKSYEAALACRESMVKAVEDLLADDGVSEYGKQVAIGMFHSSLTPGFLIVSMVRGVFHSPMACSPLSSEEREKLRHLMAEHFIPVNALVGMHWYALAGVVGWVFFVIASMFRWLNPYKMARSIEDELSQRFLGRYAH